MTNRLRASLLILGETACGIAAAVSAAHEGVDTILVTSGNMLGGVLPSLGAIETHYPGVRSPFVEAFKRRIIAHYRETYGEDSPQFRTCTTLESNNPMVTFEPKVAAHILREMVESEPRIRVIRRAYPLSVEMAFDRLTAVNFRSFDGDQDWQVEADVFIDATDEGDLAALAGVPYRVGRESRWEYGEPHAGKVFTRYVPGKYPLDAAQGRLNLLPKWTTLGLMNGSTGEGDDNIQDYSYRLCLSSDPHNRRLPDKPRGYNRDDYLAIALDPDAMGTHPYALQHRFLTYSLRDMIAADHLIHGHALPNGKRSWNATNFTGAGKRYPEADWQTRREIAAHHRDHALGILYFLQNDDAVPEDIRQMAREWGLARDEFTETENIPEHMYVREARRIVGRYTFTENDNMLAPGLERAPIQRDSIAITEFPNDSLPCTTERRTGTLPDGQTFLMETSRPGQIPYRSILPERLHNLIVPLCASVTHVAWGTFRQTPTQIQIGEASASAAVMALRLGMPPGKLDVRFVQAQLLKWGAMLSFFNDLDMATPEAWVPAIQFLGTCGFFASYDARPNDPLTQATAALWVETAGLMRDGRLFDPNERARKLPADAADALNDSITLADFMRLLADHMPDAHPEADGADDAPVTRAHGGHIIYTLLTKPSAAGINA